jgi:hypothetical protein
MSTQSLTHHTDSDAARLALVDGLHALADFYYAHPGVPLPTYPTLTHCADTPAEVEALAAALGTPVNLTITSGCHTRAHFHGLRFKAFYIAPTRVADFAALMSYDGSVEPDLPRLVEPAPTSDPVREAS